MFFVRNLLEIHDTKDSIVNNEQYPIEPGEHETSSQHEIIQQADWQSLLALANQEITVDYVYLTTLSAAMLEAEAVGWE